jgi:penicillin-binding protein 1A
VYGTFPLKEDPKTAVIWEAFQPQTEPRRSYRRSQGESGDEQDAQQQQRQAQAPRPRMTVRRPQPAASPQAAQPQPNNLPTQNAL